MNDATSSPVGARRSAGGELTRDELRAHLSNVEAQVRAALRIIAAESKGMQQAHAALRADLSSALVRLQSELSSNTGHLDSKVDRLISDVNALRHQRRTIAIVLATAILTLGVTLGVVLGMTWYVLKDNPDVIEALIPPDLLGGDKPVEEPASERR